MTKLFCALLCLLMCESAFAVVRTDLTKIAVVGDSAPVTSGDGVFFETFRQPMINNSGEVAFEATIDNPVGDLIYKQGIWATDGNVLGERVRAGQVAPGTLTAGTLFSGFYSSTFNDIGQVGFEGTTNETSSNAGYWINSSAGNTPIAVSKTPVNGFPWTYHGIHYVPALNNQGEMAFNLAIQEVGSSALRNGIFVNDASSVDPIALQGVVAPGTTGSFGSIIRTEPPINESGETAVSTLVVDPIDGHTLSSAIYKGNSQSLELVAQTGINAAGTDANFSSFSFIRRMPINSQGDTVFNAFVQGGTSTAATDRGIWRTHDNAIELLARRGDVALPATDSSAVATFSTFFNSLIDDTGQVVFAADLAGDDITFSNSNTLWSACAGELELLVRAGTPAPGTSDLFASVSSFSSNRLGQVAVLTSAGGKAGIWAQDPGGNMRLIVRAGDMVEVAPGELRSITAIDQFTISGGSDGRSRVINDAGQIVFNATLDNGIKGIFVSDAASYYLADFNRDGSVDGDDLTEWQAAYSLGTSAGDADGDGQSNGRDFLIWQRQFGYGSVATLAANIPEPTSALLLIASCTAILSRRGVVCFI